MTDLKRLLINGDPVAREPELDAFDAQAMRQRVVVEARNQPAAAPLLSWPRPLALAGAIAACLALAVTVGLQLNREAVRTTPDAVAPRKPDARRQMQFSTPGGTRIIWTFHEEMDL